MATYYTFCNDCLLVMHDENPQPGKSHDFEENSLGIAVPDDIPVQGRDLVENRFYACPNCRTDDHLMDVRADNAVYCFNAHRQARMGEAALESRRHQVADMLLDVEADGIGTYKHGMRDAYARVLRHVFNVSVEDIHLLRN